MNDTIQTATFGTHEIENLNLAAWLITNGFLLTDRKRVRVSVMDSTTHDTTRGSWTFSQMSVDGKKDIVQITSEFQQPKGEAKKNGEFWALCCHNFLVLKTCVLHGAPLFYSYTGESKKQIRLSNKAGIEIKQNNIATGQNSLVLCSIAVTLGALPLSFSRTGRFYLHFAPHEQTMNAARYLLTHQDAISETDESPLAMLCAAAINKNELQKDIYTPQETLALKTQGGQIAYFAENISERMQSRIAENLGL